MKISIERTIADDAFAETFPYIARVQIVTETKDVGRVYQIPIFVRYQGLKKTFGADVCGFRLEDKKPHNLAPQIEKLLKGLVNASRLPSYVFIARRARAIFPVYTIRDEVMAITPVGPVFKHVELAKVREYLTDFLHEAHILGEKGRSDKLHVRGISKTTLGLRRPVLYLKKRIPEEVDFWAPVFQSGDGKTIYTYAASDRREVSRQSDREVLDLHRLVADALQQDQRLTDPYDLRPDRLMPGYWERLRATLTQEGSFVLGEQEMTLFRDNGRFWLAVEARPDEDRYGLFLGQDDKDVRRRVERDFKRRDII